LRDQSSYYLLGYYPGDASFDRRFHKLEVKVVTPGLIVRSRTGYVGEENQVEEEDLNETAERRVVRKMFSPFQTVDLRTRMKAFFMGGDKANVRSSVLVEGDGLQ